LPAVARRYRAGNEQSQLEWGDFRELGKTRLETVATPSCVLHNLQHCVASWLAKGACVPILYVHGVNTRSRQTFFAIEPLLRRFVAPAISNTPADVFIEDYYWGTLGIRLGWNGASRPRTWLLGMGPGSAPGLIERSLAADEQRSAIRSVPAPMNREAEDVGPLHAPGRSATRPAQPSILLSSLKQDELADLLAGMISNTLREEFDKLGADPEALAAEQARLLLAADHVAHDPATFQSLVGKTPEQQLSAVLDRINEEADRDSVLAGKGEGAFGRLLRGVKDRISEAFDRTDEYPGYLASKLAGELRPALNEQASNFVGDVFVYLHSRDDPQTRPGRILNGLVEALKKAHANKMERGNEPLVVLTHSMGGQLVWDTLTSLLPNDENARHVRIDFWCAAASQVGFFIEAKLFAESVEGYGPGKPVPFPSNHLGAWWNVWDYNDFLSFTVKDICAGADDEPYSSGSSLLAAHSAYFERPSFFRAFAEKVERAAKNRFTAP
jgi:hypothetical protein